MHMQLKTKGHSASTRRALSLAGHTRKHASHAGTRSFHILSKTTPAQPGLFDALNVPKPPVAPLLSHLCAIGFNNINRLEILPSNSN